MMMKEAQCPKCNSNEIIAKNIKKEGGAEQDCIYVVYCTNCGHIIGTAGAGGN
jgi:uncharacterized Zn finger protein